MTKTSSVSKLEKIGVGHMLLILLLLNLLIFFIPSKEKVEKVEVIKQKAMPEAKATIQEAPAAPDPSSIGISPIVWMNPDQLDNMRVKFKLTNHNLYPVSKVEIEFKYYDVLGELIEGSQTKGFPDVIAAVEEKEYHDFVLGGYPEDTTKVMGEVLSVSRASSD